MTFDIESLERATLDAVAPPTVELFRDWLLPFDNTTIGRAISAVPLRHDDIDSASIAEIELRYKQRGYKAQFRVADVVGLVNTHDVLQERGYSPNQPTLTMVGNVGDFTKKSTNWTTQLARQTSDDWKAVYLSEGFDSLDGANRIRALSRSACLIYAHIADDSGPIAAGTASFSQGWASLHGLRTIANMRGKGCAQAIIATLGKVAISRKIERCFLQVEEHNTMAIQLYSHLGFQTAWRYHYWRKPT
jgi:ribosomal protein S18 acetylase RimI-like enzyme